MTYSDRQQRQKAEDYALRSKALHWETKDLMQMPRDVPSVLGFSRALRVNGPKAEVVERTAPVCTGRPKSFAQRDHRSDYALRLELGQRAYDQLTGHVSKRPKAATKPKATVVDRSVLEGKRPSAGVVVLGSEQARSLGLGNMAWLADE